MMHGHEKSDSVIVAVKPANKAVQFAAEQSAEEPAVAEPGEPRAETEENADQQSTCRAQSRVSVSQALDRIRKVAKERKKERFTVLSDTPVASAIAGCVIPTSRSSTIWMPSRCAGAIFHRSAVFNRRTSALLHLTICSSRIRW